MLLFSNVLEYGAQTFVFALKKCVDFFISKHGKRKEAPKPSLFLNLKKKNEVIIYITYITLHIHNRHYILSHYLYALKCQII